MLVVFEAFLFLNLKSFVIVKQIKSKYLQAVAVLTRKKIKLKRTA